LAGQIGGHHFYKGCKMSDQSPDVLSTVGLGALALAGSISKGRQWRDPVTGRISISIMATGIATAILLASIVRAAGVHYGVEIGAQIAIAGVAGYIGPDPIIAGISKLVLRRFGLADKKDGDNGK
jgi:hypothetical protein